ncbi:MAG TPA: CHAD domain-containing protein [Ktedonobacteraceae bacterium]|nr:CHAD domain-containing protein [Ktedonobacteraceae bacterium]
MQDHSAPVHAAIDIGSNTIHLVIAHALPASLDILVDEEEMVRIGESVNATGSISAEKRKLALSVLRKYITLAQKHAAVEPVLGVATEAIRQAKNSQEFLEAIRRETGLTVHLIDGNAEATLTFFGATYELLASSTPANALGVLDLGGGSMELVVAHQQQISWRTSVPLGSGWLHDRYLLSDPPTADDVAVARTFLHTYFTAMPIKEIPAVLIATGGSANSLWYLVQQAFPEDASPPWHLSLAQLARCEDLLRSLSAEQVARRYHQPVKRAEVLLAGMLIIQTLMKHLKLEEIQVSPHGIREGALLASARYGENWLEQVTLAGELAEEENMEPSDEKRYPEKEKGFAQESFAQSGQRLLPDRVQKMLDWRSDVLKHEDVEAVHKMRVASRRLRAVLDAFEIIGKPKLFKEVYRQIKEIADMLGYARDTDVMLENLSARLARADETEQAGLRWLIGRLQSYRQQHQKALETFLTDLDEQQLKQDISAFLSEGGASRGKS